MPTAQTQLQVYNLALDFTHEPPAQSLATESAAMRLLNRNWEITIDMLLEMYPWSFAKRRWEVTADATNPPYGWLRRYPLPPNTVRILFLTEDGQRNGDPVAHEIIGDFIETDDMGPLRFTTIQRIHEPAQWSSLFVNMVALALAQKLVAKFTNKRQYAADINAAYAAATQQAELIDTLQGTAEPIEQHDIIRVRGV